MCVAARGVVTFLELRAGRFAPVALLVVLACSEQSSSVSPPAPASAPTPPRSVDSIPTGPVSGKLGGVPFELKNAHYVVQRRERPHLDIRLSPEGGDHPCSDIVDTSQPSLWLRQAPKTDIQPGEHRLVPGQAGTWEVHYQVKENGRWRGSGRASALLAVRKLGPDLRIHGDLWACFADGQNSCVSGSFVAHYCESATHAPLRSVDAMERPNAQHRGLPGAASDAGTGTPDGGTRPSDAGVRAPDAGTRTPRAHGENADKG